MQRLKSGLRILILTWRLDHPYNISLNMYHNIFDKYGAEETRCYKKLASIKWPNKSFKCRKCGHASFYKGELPYARRCMNYKCRYDESPKAHTAFDRLRLPLHHIFDFVHGMRNSVFNDRVICRATTDTLSSHILYKPPHPFIDVLLEEARIRRPQLINRSKTLFHLRKKFQYALQRSNVMLDGDIEMLIIPCGKVISTFDGDEYLVAAIQLLEDDYFYESEEHAIAASRSLNIRRSVGAILDAPTADAINTFIGNNILPENTLTIIEVGTSLKDKIKYPSGHVDFLDFEDGYFNRIINLRHNFRVWLDGLNYRINTDSIIGELSEFIFHCNMFDKYRGHTFELDCNPFLYEEFLVALMRE